MSCKSSDIPYELEVINKKKQAFLALGLGLLVLNLDQDVLDLGGKVVKC
jgi:hypothetical protein